MRASRSVPSAPAPCSRQTNALARSPSLSLFRYRRAAKARGNYIRSHYKNAREVAAAILGMPLKKAQTYLQRVIKHDDAIPFRVHKGAGKSAQGKKYPGCAGNQVRWPEKTCRIFLDLLQNAASNAETQGLDGDALVLSHVQVNRAPKLRRRTYRAHGRINAYKSSPCHIEMIVTDKAATVAAGADLGARGRTQARLENGATA